MFFAAQDGGHSLSRIRSSASLHASRESLVGLRVLSPLGYHEAVPSFYVENFGCRATQADGAAIERQFRTRGLERASSVESAGLVVLNTCTVTASADQDARAVIRRIRRQNPDCEIVVTGCYAQRAPEEVAALPGVSRVIGNSHKHQLAEIALRSAVKTPEGSVAFIPLSSLTPPIMNRRPADDARMHVGDIFAHTELLAAPVFGDGESYEGARTRPNLKVQDGCDNRCSFCVIPSVRGHSRSLPMDRILQEINALIAAGYREVVISGINLGRWGRDLLSPDISFPLVIPRSASGEGSAVPLHLANGKSLAALGMTKGSAVTKEKMRFEDLIRRILSETTLEKLRLSSIEPMDWSDELIALMTESPRIAKHAHVPMQSGSDRILRLMHRKYRPWHYREKIEKIRAALPTAAIGADVMVGFPGETESDFAETRRMIAELPFTYLHVFTYSSRPGTPSAAMPNQVPVHIARERNRILRDLAAEKKLAFMRSLVGTDLQAITLQASPQPRRPETVAAALLRGESVGKISRLAFTAALTDNYLKLHLWGHHDPNRWLTARVVEVEGGVLCGTAS